ncbi:MAG: hypothetical protein IKK43_00490 [Clostridia bacterium]|nr:hypothetical protein [Clostridia bacterium]
MRESRFAKQLTSEQICSFLQKVGFNNPIPVTRNDVPTILAEFYDFCISNNSCDWNETFYIFFKDNNIPYLMMYTDYYFSINKVLRLQSAGEDIIPFPHDPQTHKIAWGHLLYSIFKKDYEVFWWEERYESRQRLEESLNQALRDFDDESDKTIKKIKNGKY